MQHDGAEMLAIKCILIIVELQMCQAVGCDTQILVGAICVHNDQTPIWIIAEQLFSKAHHVVLWQRLVVEDFGLSCGQGSIQKK